MTLFALAAGAILMLCSVGCHDIMLAMYVALPKLCSKRHMLDIERIRQLIKVYEEMRDCHPKDSLEHEALDHRIRELTEKIKNLKVVQA